MAATETFKLGGGKKHEVRAWDLFNWDEPDPETGKPKPITGYTYDPEVAKQQMEKMRLEALKKQADKEIADTLVQTKQEDQRKRGRASTLLTGAQGLLDTPYVSRRTLLGY